MEDYLVLKSEVSQRFVFEDPGLTPEAKCALRQAYRRSGRNGHGKGKAQAGGTTDRHVYGCLYCNFMGVKKNWLKHLRTRHRGVYVQQTFVLPLISRIRWNQGAFPGLW